MIEKLSQALDRRVRQRQALAAGTTTAFRLFNGEREGIEGLVADRYGDVVILQHHEGKSSFDEKSLRAVADFYLTLEGVKSIYLKRFVADRSQQAADEAYYSPEPFAGEKAAAELAIRENDLSFLIRPYDGFSTGIFLDQRENRRLLAQNRAGKSVLNCFAYTCAFSVYAAAAGAKTTSVDLSAKYLDWGKNNFRANGLKADDHRFFATDVFGFFGAARKRAETYDLVIVDPPSFSRSKKGVFSLKKDLPELLREAANVVAKGGELFFSCNYSGWIDLDVRKAAQKSWGGFRKFTFLEVAPLPEDFSKEASPISRFRARLD